MLDDGFLRNLAFLDLLGQVSASNVAKELLCDCTTEELREVGSSQVRDEVVGVEGEQDRFNSPQVRLGFQDARLSLFEHLSKLIVCRQLV